MQSKESQEVISRFFEALARLKADRVIRGKQTFTARYGINRWNMNTLQKDLSRDIIQVAWLTYLVRDYDVSPMWLLTGYGEFYRTPASGRTPSEEPKVRGRKEPSPPREEQG